MNRHQFWVVIFCMYCMLMTIFVLTQQAHADTANMPVCNDAAFMHQILVTMFGEVPVRVEAPYELWLNEQTKTYTELWYPNPDTACIVGEGVYERLG